MGATEFRAGGAPGWGAVSRRSGDRRGSGRRVDQSSDTDTAAVSLM